MQLLKQNIYIIFVLWDKSQKKEFDYENNYGKETTGRWKRM